MDGPAVALPDSDGSGGRRYRYSNVTRRDIDGVPHQMAGSASATNGSIRCETTMAADYPERFSSHRSYSLENYKQFCGR
jgi:hypothetical protein